MRVGYFLCCHPRKFWRVFFLGWQGRFLRMYFLRASGVGWLFLVLPSWEDLACFFPMMAVVFSVDVPSEGLWCGLVIFGVAILGSFGVFFSYDGKSVFCRCAF